MFPSTDRLNYESLEQRRLLSVSAASQTSQEFVCYLPMVASTFLLQDPGVPEGIRVSEIDDTGFSNSDGITNRIAAEVEWDFTLYGAGGEFVDFYQWKLMPAGSDPDSADAPIVDGQVEWFLTSTQLPSWLDDGEFSFFIRTIQENDGLASSWGSTGVTLDTQTPETPFIPDDVTAIASGGGVYRDSITADATPNFAWQHSDFGPSEVQFFYEIDEATTLTQPFPDFGEADYTLRVDQTTVRDFDYGSLGLELETKTWNWRVRAVDLAGNMGAPSDRVLFRVREGNLPSNEPGHSISGRIGRDEYGIGSEHAEQADLFFQRVVDSDGSSDSILGLGDDELTDDTWVVIHGRADRSSSFFELASTIDEYQEGDQVLVLDWGDGSNDNPGVAGFLDGAEWIPAVADWSSLVLTSSLGLSASSLHFVGHSWGSYLAYELAKQVELDTGQKVGSIVALDPAFTSTGYDSSQVDFNDHANISWAFYGGGQFGSANRAVTADEAYNIDYKTGFFELPPITNDAHSAPIYLFNSLVKEQLTSQPRHVAKIFDLGRLLEGQSWQFLNDGFSGGFTPPGVSGFEGRFRISNINGTDAEDNKRWGDLYEEIDLFEFELLNGELTQLSYDSVGPILSQVGGLDELQFDPVEQFDFVFGREIEFSNDGDWPVSVSKFSLVDPESRFVWEATIGGEVVGNTNGNAQTQFLIPAGESLVLSVQPKTDQVGLFAGFFSFLHDGGTNHQVSIEVPLASEVTAISAPFVEQLWVSSSQWTSDFQSYLDENGLGDNGFHQLQYGSTQNAGQEVLPWRGIDRIRVQFSEDVAVTENDIVLTSSGNEEFATNFAYDPETFVAEFDFATRNVENWMINLSDRIRSRTTERALDGEKRPGVENTADGPGGNFNHIFGVVAGDVDGSGRVTANDVALLRTMFNQDSDSELYSSTGDFDGSGRVSASDFAVLRHNFNQALPEEPQPWDF